MTDDNTQLRNEDDNEAIQAVVDRVLSYQAGAPADTVRTDLEDGLKQIGESRPDEWLRANAEQISDADPAQS